MEQNRKYDLIASDLDGTLLSREQRVSFENFAAISELTRLGVHFVPASGRCIGEMPADVMGCPDVKYLITSDGATVWDKEKKEVLLSRYIPRDLVKFIIEESGKYLSYSMAHDKSDCFYDRRMHTPEIIDACHVNPYFIQLIESQDIPLDDYNGRMLASDTVELFCIFFADEGERQEFERKCLATGRLATAQSAAYNIEIYSIEAGKGNTLAALAEHLGIPIERTVAVGDSTNDLSLIRSAGLGLAMENACDELKAAADKTICHFSDHSAKYILDNFIKG